MSWFRAPVRLINATTDGDPTLAAALRDYGAERGDAAAVARLELQLRAALAAPRAAYVVPAAPVGSPGLWAFAAFVVLSWCLRAALPSELDVSSQQLTVATSPSKLEIASRLGVGPRELAHQEALDSLQLVARR